MCRTTLQAERHSLRPLTRALLLVCAAILPVFSVGTASADDPVPTPTAVQKGVEPTWTPVPPTITPLPATSTPLPFPSPTFVLITATPTDTPQLVLNTPTATATPSYASITPTVAISPTATEPAYTPTIADIAATETATPSHVPHTEVPTHAATASATPSATVTTTPSVSQTATWLPPGPDCAPKPGPAVLKLDVPYIHQVMDVDGANGNWACGPTSIAMVLAYYGKLEPWADYLSDVAAALPNPATPPTSLGEAHLVLDRGYTPTPIANKVKTPGSITAADFAPYITKPYSNNGHTYSAVGSGPGGTKIAGLYGAVAPAGLADWGRMIQVLQWHGLESKRIGISWNEVVAALKRGHPVLIGNDLTPEGHILVAVGYTNNGHLLVNDPYGNRFTDGYGANSGNNVFYRYDCMRVRNALEVIGTYPPPPRPTRTAITAAPVSQEQVSAGAPAAPAAGSGQPAETSAAAALPRKIEHDDGLDTTSPRREPAGGGSAAGPGTGLTQPYSERSGSASRTHSNAGADASGVVLWSLRLLALATVAFGLYALASRRIRPTLAHAEASDPQPVAESREQN